tara:strand:+ start:943 stop:1245 length:303 start_codon:yes stop_codon:yes gene_type:complete
MTNLKRNVEDADVVERLRQTFRDSKKSQQELADILGCSRSYVGNIMSGRALLSGRVMRKLLDQGYDIHWILSGTSQSEEIRKLQEKIDTVKELLKEAYTK